MDRSAVAASAEGISVGRNASLGFWSVVLQWGRFGIAALVFLTVARWLSLAEIGAVAVVATPLRFLQVLHRVGIAESVIIAQNSRQKERDTEALFLLSMLAAAFSVALLLIGSVLVQVYVKAELPLGIMLASLALVPVFNGLGAVSEGLLRNRLRIKALALRTLVVQITAALAAIYAAKTGAGVWALILFLILNAGMNAIAAISLARWVPHDLPRRIDIARNARSFVILSAQALLANLLQPMVQLSVGIWLGLSDAGALQIALRFLSLLDAVAVAPLRFLALPLLVSRAGSADILAPALLRGLRLTGLIASLVYLGAAAIAPGILTVFVGVNHAGTSAPLLQIMCLFGLISAINMVLMQALTAIGQAYILVWRNGAILGLTAVLIWPALGVSITATVASAALASFVVTGIVLIFVPVRLGVTFMQAVGAVGPSLIAGLLMAIFVQRTAISTLLDPMPDYLTLVLLIGLGLGLYAIFTALFARAAVSDLRRVIFGKRVTP